MGYNLLGWALKTLAYGFMAVVVLVLVLALLVSMGVIK